MARRRVGVDPAVRGAPSRDSADVGETSGPRLGCHPAGTKPVDAWPGMRGAAGALSRSFGSAHRVPPNVGMDLRDPPLHDPPRACMVLPAPSENGPGRKAWETAGQTPGFD